MPLRVAVLGFGTFGQFLARRWVQRGHTVYGYSRTDYSSVAKGMGVAFFTDANELAKKELDVVIIAVSILSFEKVTAASLLHGGHGYIHVMNMGLLHGLCLI